MNSNISPPPATSALSRRRTSIRSCAWATRNLSPQKEPLTQRADGRDWNKGSLEMIKRLERFWAGPCLRSCVAVLLAGGTTSTGRGQRLAAIRCSWCSYCRAQPRLEAVRGELWLANRSETPPRRIGRCRYTEVRPYLDGKLNDPCWQDWQPMILDNAVGDTTKTFSTKAMFAFDQEFLYIAVKCRHPHGLSARRSSRARDADVDAYDRVSILLDLDRDYATYYHIHSIDENVGEDAMHDDILSPDLFGKDHSTLIHNVRRGDQHRLGPPPPLVQQIFQGEMRKRTRGSLAPS